MDDTDVRDLAGRATRLIAAFVIGSFAAVAIAVCLPIRNHFPDWWTNRLSTGNDKIDIALVVAGAVGLSLGYYAVLGSFTARRRRVLRLPRAAARYVDVSSS